MNIDEYIKNKRAIQTSILNYIDSEDDNEDEFQHLRQVLNKQNIQEDESELRELLILINIISNNYHRSTNFFTKLEKIIHLFSDDIKNKFSNYEIYQIFNNNKRILLYLLQENIITLEKKIILDMHDYHNYFLPEIKTFINEKNNIKLFRFNEKLIQMISTTVPSDFNDKRKIGENESYLCNLIRNDSIEEFIIYVNKNNISLNSIIKPSIFETNLFLIKKSPTLIEYSAFYGSIQIFQYLRFNNVNLTPKLWQYTIHSQNAEIIHLLEDNKVKPPNNSFKNILNESIICHHNNIANYIKETLLQSNDDDVFENIDDDVDDDVDDDELNELSCIFRYRNYELFPDDFSNTKFVLYNLIGYNYSKLLDLFINSQQIPITLLNLDDYILKENRLTVFGESSLATSKLTNQKFLIEKSYMHFDYYDFNVFDILIKTRYPSLLQAKGFNIIKGEKHNEQNAVFLYDYFENGTLKDYIDKKIDGKISTELNTNDYILILGLSLGLKYLHDHDIVHVSFLPSDIFIDENFYPVISNYELSEKLLRNYLTRECEYEIERMLYVAPEFLNVNTYYKYTNIYSLSLMIYQILTGKILFKFRSRYEAFRGIMNGRRPDVQYIQNTYIADFLNHCWNNNPEERLTINDVIDFITNPNFYSYFNSLDHESIKRYLDIYGDEFNNLKNKF